MFVAPPAEAGGFAFARLDRDRGLAGVAGERVAGGERARQSPISASICAAVMKLLGSLNSDRKTAPSGWARTAVAICRSSVLICVLSVLSVARGRARAVGERSSLPRRRALVARA